MASFAHRVLVFVLLLTTVTYSRIIPLEREDLHHRVRQVTPIDPQPTCRSLCEACNGCTSSQPIPTKRDLTPILYGTDSADVEAWNVSYHILQKRILNQNLDAENIGQYILGQLDPRNSINLCPKDQYGDINFTILRRFGSRALPPIGTGGLEGCTVLTIISNQAVYMAHLWETLSFTTSEEPDAFDMDFTGNVENLLRGINPRPHASGDFLDASAFQAADKPLVYIMTPALENPQQAPQNPNLRDPTLARSGIQFLYGIDNLLSIVKSIIPVAGTAIYPYMANVALQQHGYQGTALFEYDPNYDGNGNKGARLLYEQVEMSMRRIT